MDSEKRSFRSIPLFLSIVAAISLIIGVPMAFAALDFSNNTIIGDSGVIIDATGTIAIGTSTATTINIGNPSSTITLIGATTTVNNLAITSLAASSSPCLAVSAAGAVTTTTCGGAISYANTSSIVSAMNIGAWGDSLTLGDEDYTGYTYPNLLNQYLPGPNVRDFGVGGQTSSQIASRFLAASSTWPWFTVIWAGRNNLTATGTVLSDIASMVAKTQNGNYLVLSVVNGEGENCASANLADVQQINSALSSTYGPTGHYLDIRNILLNSYNPSIPADVIDYNNCIPPYSLRAVDFKGTLTAAIGAASTSFSVTPTLNAPYVGQILTIGSEQIYVSAISGNTITSAIRGYAGTTASSYAANTSFVGTDYLHYGANGYMIVAKNVANSISAIQNASSPSSVITAANMGTTLSGIPIITSGDSIGLGSLALANDAGGYETAIGYESMQNNTTGLYNTAVGANSLGSNTTGTSNTAVGFKSLAYNTTGGTNSALGYYSLELNTAGTRNTGIGFYALRGNTTGGFNTAVGYASLQNNTTGQNNAAFGTGALGSNLTGTNNTAVGNNALFYDTGAQNTGIGYQALENNVAGSFNIGIGDNAGLLTSTGASNAATNYAVDIGYEAYPLASGDTNEIVIGANATGNGNNTATIGNSSTAATFLGGNSLEIGTSTKAFCMEGYDSVNTTTLEYIYTVNGALTATTTKPSFCQ